jgi:glycosyltransferase involved in cell wall biosynthesis
MVMSDLVNHTPPLVTVAMPIYNAGKYLRLAVFSILEQTYPHWELLIIDDGSTDNALASIADIQDARIHIHRDGQNKGLAARLNECIDLARGEYIARMDQDDVSYPQRFERQIAALKNDPHLDMVGVRALTITDEDEAISWFPRVQTHAQICAKPWVGFYLPHPTWMGKTTWFKKYRYALPGSFYSEDMELLLRSYDTSRLGMVDEVLFAYRVRTHIVWHKQLKARKAVLHIQQRAFTQRRQWGFIGLAMLVFALRLLSDGIRIVKQAMNIQTTPFDAIPDDVAQQWNATKTMLFAASTRQV